MITRKFRPHIIIVFLALASAPCLADTKGITPQTVREAERLIGLDFSDAKIEMMLPGLKGQLEDFEAIHKFPLSNSIPPAIQFNPLPRGFTFERERKKFKMSSP